ncbi:MAG TPA: hypothetical protein VGZ26_00865 [Pirellulales bacterium]|nr:hypothetical protein [Pirellulales bacterium]
MTRTAEVAAREAKIAELKRLITSGNYETLEKLEDAVDAFLWSEADRLQAPQEHVSCEMGRAHPK